MGHHRDHKVQQKLTETERHKLEQERKDRIKQRRKEQKQKRKEKRARLIISNIPFDTTEENLRNHFEQFGKIKEVHILKRESGLLVGCAFIQFNLVQQAAKARHHSNGKPFLGRDILVDFAKAKDKYVDMIKQEDEVKVKEEPVDPDEIQESVDEIKQENDDEPEIKKDDEIEDTANANEEERVSNDAISNIDEKEEQDTGNVESSRNEVDVEMEETNSGDDDNTEASEDEKYQLDELEETSVESEDSSNESVICEENDEKQNEQDVTSEEIASAQKKRFESNDVIEGKTIFIKNVPFTATNEDLKDCMNQFGPTHYALICIDKYTEHSKGTAFVKFHQKEDAERALVAGTELTLFGSVLDCHRALGRSEVQQKVAAKHEIKTSPRDSRNLYLVKEGVVLAGSKAAEGVSASDMAKRLQLEQYKTQMLRNLNMFVSRERLVINNLPASWDDDKLRSLIKNNSPKNSVIKEARIMRDMKNVDAHGLGKSKELGFVSFARHEDALFTLRNLNNNPKVFSTHKRPVVSFSIENRAMIKAKQKRLEKSRLHNPKSKQFDPNAVKADKDKKRKRLEAAGELQTKRKRIEVGNDGEKVFARNKAKWKRVEATDDAQRIFAGVAAKPGVQKMRSRYNLKTQAKLHHENLKKEKKKQKFAKKSLKERKQNFIKQPKQKVNNKTDNDTFAKLVASYKTALLSVPQKKRKWYEGQD